MKLELRAVVRLGVPAVVLAGTLYVGYVGYAGDRPVPVPPLGPFLHPTTGVWAVAAQDELPVRVALRIPGTRDSVRILFDDRAVPHIFATRVEDAYRALGYLHARFRLFQLEIQTRATKGTLSEWFGEQALESDRSQRALGLAWSAEREAAALDPASTNGRFVLAYADGVNARIDELTSRDLPLEYRLLDATPQRWEPVNTFHFMKRMSYTLAYGHPDRLFERLTERVGAEAAAALLPLNSPIQEPMVPTGRNAPRFDAAQLPPPRLLAADHVATGSSAVGVQNFAGPPPGGMAATQASNNWVIAPWRTANGHALLSGDPHLDLTLPAIWFEAHLVVPGQLDVYGVTFPGAPPVVIGFNRDVAWSFTNTGADVLDYYEETLDDLEHPRSYRLDGAWRPLERRVEVYRDRKGRVLAIDTLYHTHRGPLLFHGGRARSMRWTVLEEESAVTAFLGLATARSVDEWLRLMQAFRAPIQNGVVADRAGEIAIISAGRYPIRPAGKPGLEVWDGTTSDSDWLGFLPPARFPFARNPAQGFLASANQQPLDPATAPFYLGAWWPSPWRAMRINQLLRADSAVTREAMQRYQTDPGSARADLFMPAFLDAAKRQRAAGDRGPTLALAARLLEEWDRRYTRDNERAILFELAMDALFDATWDELLDPDDSTGRRRIFTPPGSVLASLLRHATSMWWDDRRTETVESRDAVLAASLVAGYDRALEKYGAPGEGGWRWDRVRQANIYHLLGYRSLSALNLPVPGGPGTISPLEGAGTEGASWRMVVELGPEVRAWGTYPGGQSGNPASPWYTDRLDRWIDGALDPLLFPRTPKDLPVERIVATFTVRGGQ